MARLRWWRRTPDVRAFVAGLEEWIIRTLAAFNVRGERRDDPGQVRGRRIDPRRGRHAVARDPGEQLVEEREVGV